MHRSVEKLPRRGSVVASLGQPRPEELDPQVSFEKRLPDNRIGSRLEETLRCVHFPQSEMSLRLDERLERSEENVGETGLPADFMQPVAQLAGLSPPRRGHQERKRRDALADGRSEPAEGAPCVSNQVFIH